jgi:phytoene dehydrogenase-like protein
MKHKEDVIIIGSGVGGLSCGAYLAKNGYKVKNYEFVKEML